MDGICLRRSRDGELENEAIFVAIAVNKDGCCKVFGAAEGVQ